MKLIYIVSNILSLKNWYMKPTIKTSLMMSHNYICERGSTWFRAFTTGLLDLSLR